MAMPHWAVLDPIMAIAVGIHIIVTGVNLPMVIKLASVNKEMTLHELAKEVEDQGKEAITRASVILEPQKMKKDA